MGNIVIRHLLILLISHPIVWFLMLLKINIEKESFMVAYSMILIVELPIIIMILYNIGYDNRLIKRWKVDWPMRWMIEKVTFETGGIDHSASNGSKVVSEKVAREIFNYEPPVYIPYNFIGIKDGGAKMSSSNGNVLTITDLLKVYDKNIIWWFYARFDIALDNDVIRYYSEFDRWVKLYFKGNIDDKNKSILDLTEVTEII